MKQPIKQVPWSFAVLLPVLLALILLGGAGGARAQETVSSACEIDYPPFCLVNADGRPTGFSVELLQATLAAMNRLATFTSGSWTEVRGRLERGEVQALPLVGRTPERESHFDFTIPYMSIHGAIVVRSENTDIRRIADLRGRRVAVMKGDNAEEFLRREERGCEILTTSTFVEAFRELDAGRCDAVVIQRLVAVRLLQETGLKSLRIIENPIEGFRQDFCFAVREGDRETLAILNEGLALVMANGTYRQLHSKWFAALELPTNRPIIIGGDHHFPPFEYLDDRGQPTGFSVELTRAIAREMNLNIRFELGSWDRVLADLKKGDIDAIQGMYYSPARESIFRFSPSYLASHYVSVVRRDSGPPPETISALTSRRLIIQSGDVIREQLTKSGWSAPLAEAPNQEEVLRAVRDKRADCALVVRTSALHFLKKNGWQDLTLGRSSFLAGEYSYAVPTGNSALLAQLSEGLRLVEKSGEYHRLFEKWLGIYKADPWPWKTLFRVSATAMVGFLFAIVLITLWSRSLQKQVAEKTRELMESANLFRDVFETANVSKSVTLPNGQLNVNQACADFLGYSREELATKTWREITPAEDIELTDRSVAPLYAGKELSARFEKRYLRKDGSIRWGDVSIAVRRDQAGKPLHFITTIVDITERKLAEEKQRVLQEQLYQAQKMESVGRLAGGIAHDFNNMLGVILGHTELAQERLPSDSPVWSDLHDIKKAAERSADLTRQLLGFARKQTAIPRPIDLNETVGKMLKMIRRLMGENIEMVWIPGKAACRVNVDPSQIDQILANLCTNARDAIRDTGKVTIATEVASIDAAFCKAHPEAEPGTFVLLTVTDTGCGMNPDILSHLFEPFFTTKEVGKGTGLGLATVYGIVKQNRGFILVTSHSGQGTTFRIFFPHHAAAIDLVPTPVAAVPIFSDQQTVLVVEDEPGLLDLTSEMLSRRGFRVLAAATPEEALRLGKAHADELLLLVSDVIMPGMNGRELAEQLTTVIPRLKVLFMSGYTADTIAHHGVLAEGVHFLQKPFSSGDLEEAIRKALEPPPPPGS